MPHDRSVGEESWFSGDADCDSGTDWYADPVAKLRRRRSILSAQEDTETTTARAARRPAGPDSWYLWLARDLGRVARWARGEAGVVTASARAAAATTREVTRSVLQGRTPTEQGPLEGLLDDLAARLAARADADAPAIETDESFWELIDQLQTSRARPAEPEPAPVAPPIDPDSQVAGADDPDEPVTDAVVAEDPDNES